MTRRARVEIINPRARARLFARRSRGGAPRRRRGRHNDMRATNAAPAATTARVARRARATRATRTLANARVASAMRGDDARRRRVRRESSASGTAGERDDREGNAASERDRGGDRASTSARSSKEGSSLERQIAVTQRLREGFERDPFLRELGREAFAANVEYDNDVHAVRGLDEYRELMEHFSDATKSALKGFKFVTRRASSIEPGVLLIQWTAVWEGARFGKKFSNLLLGSMHEGAVRRIVEGEYGEKVAPGYPATATVADGKEPRTDLNFRLFGRTTYKVNRDGLIASRLDRIDFRTDPEPGSQSGDDFFPETPEEEEAEWEQLAEETAVNMFYNTLSPPGKNETSWFLDVLIELEWQSFQRQMGDTTSVLSKQEYVSVIYAVLASAIAAPIFIIVGLTALLLSPDQAGDPDSLDAAMTMGSDLAKLDTGANGSPVWGADVFLDLYKGKIGA